MSQTMSLPRTVRVTTDLDADLFDEFRDLAHENRMHQTKMLRALVRMMVEDEKVADRALELARSYAAAERQTPRNGDRR